MLGLIALLLAAGAARADDLDDLTATGPLGLRTQGVLRELFLDPILLDARPRDAAEVDIRWAAANSWSIPTLVTRPGMPNAAEIWTDEQADSLTGRIRLPWSAILGQGTRGVPGSSRPLWERFSTAVEWRLTEHWGGWSDAAIGGFHGLIGGFDYDRNLYTANQTNLVFRDVNGVVAFDLHGATFALGDVVARSQFLLVEADHLALALRFDFKAPTGKLSLAGSSGGWDESLGLAATFTTGKIFTLHAMATLSQLAHFSADTELQPKRWHGTGDLSMVFKIHAVSLLVEDRIVTPLLGPGWTRVEFGGSDGLISSALFASFRPHNQVSVGVRWKGISLWLSEDYTPGSNPRSTTTFVYVSNSPDIVLGLSYTKGF